MKTILLILFILSISSITFAQNITIVNRSKQFNIKEIYIGKNFKVGNTKVKKWTENLIDNEIEPSCAVILRNKDHGDFILKVIWRVEFGNNKGDIEKKYNLYNITKDTSFDIKFGN